MARGLTAGPWLGTGGPAGLPVLSARAQLLLSDFSEETRSRDSGPRGEPAARVGMSGPASAPGRRSRCPRPLREVCKCLITTPYT